MGNDICKLNYWPPYGNEVLNFAKERTTLKNKDIVLILDIIIFFIRKSLIEKQKINFIRFGALIIRKQTKKRVIRFKNAYTLILAINNNGKFEFDPTFCFFSRKEFLTLASKCLKISYYKIQVIFNMFIFTVVQEIIEKGHYKIRRFGTFYSKEVRYDKTYCKRPQIKVVNKKRVFFKPDIRFFKEFNLDVSEIRVSKRISRILALNNINRKNFCK